MPVAKSIATLAVVCPVFIVKVTVSVPAEKLSVSAKCTGDSAVTLLIATVVCAVALPERTKRIRVTHPVHCFLSD